METEILECGHPESPHGNFTRGWGRDETGKRFCYECCAKQDREYMQAHGRITLYLDQKTWKVTNWPGSLAYKVIAHSKGRHNWAGVRYDVWFLDEQGHKWHGVQYGNYTQLCHCKRVKG